VVCRYYRETSRGKRCIFLSPKDWNVLRHRYIGMCLGSPAACPIYNRCQSILNGRGFGMKSKNHTQRQGAAPGGDPGSTGASLDDAISRE
jgi:hypothetical protein